LTVFAAEVVEPERREVFACLTAMLTSKEWTGGWGLGAGGRKERRKEDQSCLPPVSSLQPPADQ
jgi:hypothetical protein